MTTPVTKQYDEAVGKQIRVLHRDNTVDRHNGRKRMIFNDQWNG